MQCIDSISECIGKLAAFIIIPNILALVYEVVARYIFNRPTLWSYEFTYFLYGAHFMLGAAYTLKLQQHIRIDVFYIKMPKHVQGIIDSVGYLILFVPVMLILIIGGISFVQESIAMQERSSVSAWRPLIWPFKLLLPLGFFLLFLQGIAELIRSLSVAFGRAK